MNVSPIPKNLMKKIHEKLVVCSTGLQFKFPYYSEIFLCTNFHETDKVPTMGVNVTTNGFNFYYNPKFTDGLLQSEVNFIAIHEIFHLIFDHCARTTKNYDRQLSNIAQDMIINTIIVNEIERKHGKDPKFPITIPKDKKGQHTALFLPKEYPSDLPRTFEHVYEWLQDEQNKRKQEQNGDQSQNGEGDQNQEQNGAGQGQEGKDPSYGPNGADNIDCHDLDSVLKQAEENQNGGSNQITLDEHLDDEVPEELKKQMQRDVLERIKARGLSNGDFESILGQLRKKKKDYLKEIKKSIAHLKGQNKNRTWAKANRKGLPFKGFKKHSSKINVMLDTSGSMGGYFEKILSFVFQNDIEINMIQCDTEVHDMGSIKNKNEFKRLMIKGMGGTVLQPSIDHIEKTYNKFPTVILTDGYCDSLDLSKLNKRVLILSQGEKCPIMSSNGKLKQIIIDPDQD